jgi:hypothetical protein
MALLLVGGDIKNAVRIAENDCNDPVLGILIS